MYGFQDKINQILRGAETIKKNSINPDTTPTPTWKVCKTFNSALLEDEKEGERLNEILCADKDEAECLVALLNNLDQEITQKTNEVARLREENETLNRQVAFLQSEYSNATCKWLKAQKIVDDARLAPAPEEPVIQDSRITEPSPEETQDGATMDEWYGGFSKIESTEPANPTCANITHKFSHCDCKQPSEKDTSTETCPSQKDTEWRERGPDEVIQEGDQVQPKHHDRKGARIWIWSHEIGATPRDQEAMRYRTLRPLPKQEEPLSIFDYHLCLCEDSGENEDLLYCLRYLRDEIQKLKEVK